MVGEVIRTRLKAAGALDGMPDELFNLIWPWGRTDLDGLRSWIRDRIDSGAWPLAEIITKFATVNWATGDGPPRRSIAQFSLKDVDAILGLPFVLSGLAQEIEAATGDIDVFDSDPTLNHRFQYALGALKAARDRGAGSAEDSDV